MDIISNKVDKLLRSLFGKIIIWSLIIACFGSFGSGSGRAVICLGQNGNVGLELLHSGDGSHCLDEHLRGQHQLSRPAQHRGQLSAVLKSSLCNACDDFEISLQLFAPRNEPGKHIINFITNPQFTTGIKIPLLYLATTLSPHAYQPVAIDPSFSHLQSTILLI